MDSDEQRRAIRTLAQERGESLAALSRMLRRNGSYLQQYVERRSPRWLSDADRRLLAQHFGVAEAALGGAEALPAETLVPWLDVTASAGAGSTVAAERTLRPVPFASGLLRELGVAPPYASLIRARGESMAPGILDGDRLLVDAADRHPGRSGRVFVLRRGDLIAVKRLAVAGARVTVASDNPAYPTETVPVAEMEVIGRVKLLLREPG